MTSEELFYQLALTFTNGVGALTSKKLISHFGSAKNTFLTSDKELIKLNRIGDQTIQNIKKSDNLKKAEKELKFIEANKINTYSINNDKYPKLLKRCYDAPLLLFYKGKINFENHPIISVVGTRQMTKQAEKTITHLIEGIAQYNPIIVSGYAYGVDINTHKSAINNNLQTLAILSHGLDTIYPKAHTKYAESMCINGGFITEYPSNTTLAQKQFVARNRIIAGISEATIVIESDLKGGSLITAQYANDYDREVFAIPGRITDKYSKGCLNLIKENKAHLITSAKDIIDHLSWKRHQKTSENHSIKPLNFIGANLKEEELKVVQYLQQNGKEHFDIISQECSIPVFKLSTILLSIELKGVIKALPGKFFDIC